MKYADIRESGTNEALAFRSVKIRTVYSVIDSHKDWNNMNLDPGPDAQLVRIITGVIPVNAGVCSPILQRLQTSPMNPVTAFGKLYNGWVASG
jgi:hypothetical protein